MPNYVNSSPWQDAANFGGAIGDRLTAALIDMPLRKQQYLTQLLQQSAQMKMEQQRLGQAQQFEQQRLGVEQQRANDEKAHYGAMDTNEKARLSEEESQHRFQREFDTTKLEVDAADKASHATLGQERVDATNYSNQEKYKMLGESAAMRLKKGKVEEATKTPLPELDGLTMEQAVSLIRRDPAQQSTDPATLKHYQAVIDGITQHLQGGQAQESSPMLQTPAAPQPSQRMINPQTKQIIELQNGQWVPVQGQ